MIDISWLCPIAGYVFLLKQIMISHILVYAKRMNECNIFGFPSENVWFNELECDTVLLTFQT